MSERESYWDRQFLSARWVFQENVAQFVQTDRNPKPPLEQA